MYVSLVVSDKAFLAEFIELLPPLQTVWAYAIECISTYIGLQSSHRAFNFVSHDYHLHFQDSLGFDSSFTMKGGDIASGNVLQFRHSLHTENQSRRPFPIRLEVIARN